jgi:Uma2 family endonuclease
MVPQLEHGDRLTRDEFERRYDAMPGLKKAELIEGIVYMPSSSRLRRHGHPQFSVCGWLGQYQARTPGIEAGAHGHVRLDLDNMFQPAVFLFIQPECRGQARIIDDDYIEGAPDLVAEVASSSVSYDLGVKLPVYRRCGVREYLIWRVLDQQIDWLALREGGYEPVVPGEDATLRSTVFPGLWLDPAALLRGDLARVLAVLQQGLEAPEHQDFVASLLRRRTTSPGKLEIQPDAP